MASLSTFVYEMSLSQVVDDIMMKSKGSLRVHGRLSLLNFLSRKIVCAAKMVHMKENGQTIRINLRYFLSLSDQYVKSYSCFSVDLHVICLKIATAYQSHSSAPKFQIDRTW
jgi:hypothetical protein